MSVNLVLISGSYSTGSAWRAICEFLPQDWNTITVTLPGYGDQPETRSLDDLDMIHIARPVIAAAQGMDGPVHLAAHSFGGQAAISAIVDGGLEPVSLTTFEANPLWPLHQSGQDGLFREILNIRDRFSAACLASDPNAARLIIDYWGGQGSWDLLSPSVQDFARAGALTNMLDWRAACLYAPDLTTIANAAFPVSFQRGEYANAAMVALTDAIAQMIPRASLGVIKGANHFLITSHPEACARAIMANVARA